VKNRWLFGVGAALGAVAVGATVAKSAKRAALQERLARLRESPVQGRNIVVVGGGFGGIHTVARLLELLPPESGWRITLVDQRNFFLFTPLLYHAATGLVDPSHILFPTRALSTAPHFFFREATVTGVDFERKAVLLDDGELPYDYLVMALGSTTNFFNQDQALRHSLTLKSSGEAVVLRNRIIDAFERADIATNAEERKRCLTFAVVGGGATGVELVGAIRGLVHGTLARQYPHIGSHEARVMLFENSERLLGGLPEDLAVHAENRLRELGVELRLKCAAANVTETELTTRTGEVIPTRTVVWAAGVRPVPLTEKLDVPRGRTGRIVVDSFMEIEGRPGCYALGDMAACPDVATGKPLPPNAAVAVRQGKALAEIILARLENREPTPFHFDFPGELVSLGRHEAVARIGGVKLTGFPAWVMWRSYYLTQLMGFKNQIGVALDWSFAYFYQRDTVRLDLPPAVADGGAVVSEVPREPSPTPPIPSALPPSATPASS
jgi:NADH dehydrogenase